MVQRALVINLWGTGERRGDPGSALLIYMADSIVCSTLRRCRTRSRPVVWANRKLNMKLRWISYIRNRAENCSWSGALSKPISVFAAVSHICPNAIWNDLPMAVSNCFAKIQFHTSCDCSDYKMAIRFHIGFGWQSEHSVRHFLWPPMTVNLEFLLAFERPGFGGGSHELNVPSDPKSISLPGSNFTCWEAKGLLNSTRTFFKWKILPVNSYTLSGLTGLRAAKRRQRWRPDERDSERFTASRNEAVQRIQDFALARPFFGASLGRNAA